MDRDERVVRPDTSPNVERTRVTDSSAARTATGVRFEPTDHTMTDLEHDRISPALNLNKDRVRWGPIFAGFLTALTTLVLMTLLGLGIGLTTINVGAAGGDEAQQAGAFSAIWGAISGILAFLLGGFVAGKTAAVFSRNWGAFNGAMVFFLALPFTLWLAGMGLGGILGTLGSYSDVLAVNLGQAQQAANQAQQEVSPQDVQNAANAVRNGALGTLLGLGLALGAAALGGAMGTRHHVEG